MNLNDTFEAEVIRMSNSGDGICKVDGHTLFVALAVVGQYIRGKIIQKKRRTFFAEIKEVLRPSPYERKPFDPDFPKAGGALWQHMLYTEQLRWKEQFVTDAVRRLAKCDAPILPIISSPVETEYRNKMEFSFGYESMQTRTMENGEKVHTDLSPGLGMNKKGNWREIVRLEKTCLAHPEMLTARKIVETFALKSGLPVWNPAARKGFWRNLVVRRSRETQQMLLDIFVFSAQDDYFWKPLLTDLKSTLPNLVSVVETIHNGPSVVEKNAPRRILMGASFFIETLSNIRFSVEHDAFFQVNTAATEKMIETISAFAGLTGGEKVLDLFCGTGALGLCVAQKSHSLTGIDIIESAVKNARENAKKNGINNARFLAGDAGKIFEERLSGASFDVAIVDPPRAGLNRKARKILGNLPVTKIVMVSCNAATLARDLLYLYEHGWKTIKVRPHDLFPQTPHVEVVAVLERKAIVSASQNEASFL